MLKFLSKWLFHCISLAIDIAFLIYCFCAGWIGVGILASVACVMTFINLFIIPNYKKKK